VLWNVRPTHGVVPVPSLVTEKRSIRLGEDAIGSVQVFVTPRFAEQRLQEDFRMTMSTILVFDLILVVSLYVLLWRLVLRPIRSVEMFAAAVSRGERKAAGTDGIRFRGEIERLRAALQTMVGQLDGRYQDLQRRDTELAQYRDRLEELVRQRTRELVDAQAELIRQERMAALGQVAATVSHELRNPLGTVKNALFSIGESLGAHATEPGLRALERARRNVDRCNRIIGELLEYARRGELRLESTALDQWLREVVQEDLQADTVRLELRLESGATLPVDRDRLRRAIVNVMTNAVQAMEEEGAADRLLEIGSTRRAQRVEIVVRDHGAGMSAEVMRRMWEPMFSTKTYGVGLGLSVVRAIMDDHGGGAEVHSEPGKGTSVTLWLPLTRGEG
jgi:signal transduction histidine kinase